jgi:hypothetical protein
MDVSVQLRYLHLKSREPVDERLSGPVKQFGLNNEKKNYSSCQEYKSLCTAYNLSPYRLSHSDTYKP